MDLLLGACAVFIAAILLFVAQRKVRAATAGTGSTRCAARSFATKAIPTTTKSKLSSTLHSWLSCYHPQCSGGRANVLRCCVRCSFAGPQQGLLQQWCGGGGERKSGRDIEEQFRSTGSINNALLLSDEAPDDPFN